jgi:hypothetical protein
LYVEGWPQRAGWQVLRIAPYVAPQPSLEWETPYCPIRR